MRRMVLDGSMLVLFLLVMCFPLLPKQLHEVLGVALSLAAGIHIYWNRKWFSSCGNAIRSARGRLSAVMNTLLLLLTVMILITGLCISNHLLKGLVPLYLQRSILLHQLHGSLPFYWMILAGIHLGLHWRELRRRLAGRFPMSGPSGAGRLLTLLLPVVFLILGIWGSFLNHVGDRLMMKHVFHTPAMQYPLGLYLLFLLAILGMYAWIGFMADNYFRRKGL